MSNAHGTTTPGRPWHAASFEMAMSKLDGIDVPTWMVAFSSFGDLAQFMATLR